MTDRRTGWFCTQRDLKILAGGALSLFLFGFGVAQIFELADAAERGWWKFGQTAILALAAFGLANIVIDSVAKKARARRTRLNGTAVNCD